MRDLGTDLEFDGRTAARYVRCYPHPIDLDSDPGLPSVAAVVMLGRAGPACLAFTAGDGGFAVGDVAAAYAGCRARITDLARWLDEPQAATTVPTCREWSVHDVVAHVTGIVDDALAGRLDGVATDPWTAAQVDAGVASPSQTSWPSGMQRRPLSRTCST